MKNYVKKSFSLLLVFTSISYANGGPKMTDIKLNDSKEQSSISKRTEETKQRMEENPRNEAIVHSFEKIGQEKVKTQNDDKKK